MFGSSISRTARLVPPTAAAVRISISCSPVGLIPALSLSYPKASHQRRHSSKTSCPPDDSGRSPSSTQAAEAARTSPNATTRNDRRGSGRSGRRKASSTAAAARETQQQGVLKTRLDNIPNLPSVPSTQHLEPSHIGLSSFFSEHRPISVTAPLPVPSTAASFGSLFNTETKPSHRTSDVMYMLSDTIDSLEDSPHSKAEKDLRWEILQNDPPDAEEVATTDGAPAHISLEQMVTQFRPFNVPPLPAVNSKTGKSKMHKAFATQRSPAQNSELAATSRRAWSTTIVVTESTHSTGYKTYVAASSPIVSISLPQEADIAEPLGKSHSDIAEPVSKISTLRERRWKRFRMGGSITSPSVMQLISVKRQRKLKMKKHKFKKLRRRTRNLRLKLENR